MNTFILILIFTLSIILWIGVIVEVIKNFDIFKEMYLQEKQISQKIKDK